MTRCRIIPHSAAKNVGQNSENHTIVIDVRSAHVVPYLQLFISVCRRLGIYSYVQGGEVRPPPAGNLTVTNGLQLTFRAAGDFMISPPLIRGYAALGMIADRGKKLRVGSGQVR